MICRDCGDTRRVGPEGVCTWRAGCEHRQRRQAARRAQLEHDLAVAVEEVFLEERFGEDDLERYHELGWCRTVPQPLRPDLER